MQIQSGVGLGALHAMTRLGKHQACLFLLLGLSLLAGWRPLMETFLLSWQVEAYTHILLILPISVAMIFMDGQFLRPMFTSSRYAGGALLVVAVLVACSTWLRSTWLPSEGLLSIRMLAMVLWWIGAVVLCLGWRVSRSLLFPLLVLFAMVPFPPVLLNWVIALLQQGSTWSARMLFVICSVPVAQDGFFLSIPGLTVQVAQECSSIRSSSMLLVTTLVLAQSMLRSSWRRTLLIGLAIPLSVAKNGLRVFSIAMLGTRVDPGYLTGRFHHKGGIIFFAVALIIILALLWILRRGEGSLPKLELEPSKAAATGD